MSDIFREVDEDVRRDKAIEFWKKNQNRFIALAVVIVLCTAGWRGYQYWQTSKAQAASASYDSALDLATIGKTAEAQENLGSLARTAPPGYAMLAKLEAAAVAGRSSGPAGVKAYDALAGDATIEPQFQDVARLRAALLLVDNTDAKGLRQRLEPLAVPTGSFRHTARELLALAALKADDVATASKWLSTILADPGTPTELRNRAEAYLSIVRGLKPATG